MTDVALNHSTCFLCQLIFIIFVDFLQRNQVKLCIICKCCEFHELTTSRMDEAEYDIYGDLEDFNLGEQVKEVCRHVSNEWLER